MAGLLFVAALSKATSGRLIPISGHGFVGMLCNELGLHRELANSIWSDLIAFSPILRGPPTTPISTTCDA